MNTNSTIAAIVLAVPAYCVVGRVVTAALARRLQRVRLAREAWHENYWALCLEQTTSRDSDDAKGGQDA